MLAGSVGPGGIHFDDPYLAQFLGVIALSFILFAGGLDTYWASVRPVLWTAVALSTGGVFITALLVGGFATAVLGFSLLEGLLLGAIISSTDAAAVFSVLRSKNVGLKGRLRPLLELESGSNDTMAVLLTIGFVSLLLQPGKSVLGLIPMFFQQMALGVLFGYLMGRGMVYLVNNLKLEYEGLYPVLSLSLVLLTYGATVTAGGNGFLAVYISGLVMGTRSFIHKNSLKRFHDGLAWLMQISMFLVLGLLVFPSRLVSVIGTGLAFSLFLMILARPAGVFLNTFRSGLSVREKILVSWVGLRGAVPIILATFPLLAGIAKADMIFNIVFFIVLTSALLQGTTIPMVAQWLKVAAPVLPMHASLLECESKGKLKCNLAEIDVPADSVAVGRQIVDLGLPEGSLIVLIYREGEVIIPGGGSVLRQGDRLSVLADDEILPGVRSIIGKPVATP
jgi:potassium/hydrogen antiporter